MRNTIFIILIGLLPYRSVFGQSNLSIEQCLSLEGFKFRDFNQADRTPKDTLIDLKNGYYEISDGETKLLQATKFNNPDGSILIAATGYYADMQCFNYFSKFYVKSKNLNALEAILEEDVMPKLKFSDFFIDSSIREITTKYLPLIQEEYYPNATVENVYEEFFDMHFIMPRYGTEIKVKLTVCDYIPLNEVNIDQEDWEKIDTQYKTIVLSYDKKKKKFVKS